MKLRLKAVLASIFVNWWWGFWRRKPKVLNVSDIEKGSLTIGDLIASQMELQEGGLINTDSGVFHESWKDYRICIFDYDGDRKVDIIKAVREITGGDLKNVKHLVDDLPDMPALIGPFKVSIERARDLLREAGVLFDLIEVDWEDGTLAVASSSPNIIGPWEDLTRGFRWTTFDDINKPVNAKYFHSPYDNALENEEFWEEIVDSDVEPPEDIIFGCEDKELSPN